MEKLVRYVSRLERSTLLGLGIAAAVLIGYANVLAGVEISASIFYLFPVSLVSWCAGRREGVLIALCSSVSWYAAEWYAGRDYSHPAIFYWNLIVMFGFFFMVSYTLSGMKRALDKEKILARLDPLTGVANGRFFVELAGKEIDRSRRYRHPLTLVYLDADNFKGLNDQFGHQIGNRLLHILALKIQKNIRNTDIAARLGGDEFAILMPETGEQIAPLALERLHGRLVDDLGEEGWPVTLSMGAAIYLHPPVSADEMIKSADRLMLQAKNEGKNTFRYKVFDSPQLPAMQNPLDVSTPPVEAV
jgi:diguanylate cyclase (GGDEF)-like protein